MNPHLLEKERENNNKEYQYTLKYYKGVIDI